MTRRQYQAARLLALVLFVAGWCLWAVLAARANPVQDAPVTAAPVTQRAGMVCTMALGSARVRVLLLEAMELIDVSKPGRVERVTGWSIKALDDVPGGNPWWAAPAELSGCR